MSETSKKELDELLRQRKVIDQKIKDLKASDLISSDRIRFEKKDPEKYDFPWQVSALMKTVHAEYETREEAAAHGRAYWQRKKTKEYITYKWQVFIREKTKEEALQSLDLTLKCLQNVKNHALLDCCYIGGDE